MGYPSNCGSSPHTWGIHCPLCHTLRCNTVHPHIRGAYDQPTAGGEGHPGSSPHTWGIQGAASMGGFQRRFIPTYVGHTSISSRFIFLTTVHPHIRGAYPFLENWGKGSPGSSPHTWGIPGNGHTVQGGVRFIPTYVGHTLSLLGQIVNHAVHPHIRGAYEGRAIEVELECGSSPHTWGIHSSPKWRKNLERFIPTYVGHTPRCNPE